METSIIGQHRHTMSAIFQKVQITPLRLLAGTTTIPKKTSAVAIMAKLAYSLQMMVLGLSKTHGGESGVMEVIFTFRTMI